MYKRILFLNNIVLDFFVKNCNKFIFIFFNFFLIILLIILFYCSSANIYCDEIKEFDHIYTTKDGRFYAYIPSTSPLAELYVNESFDELEELIDWDYQRAVQCSITYESLEKNFDKKEFDYIYTTKDKNFVAYIPSISPLTNLYLSKSINKLEEEIFKNQYVFVQPAYYIKNENSNDNNLRTFTKNNFFDPKMDLSLSKNSNVPYLSSDIIFFEQFVKKEIDKRSPDYERTKTSKIINKIFKTVTVENVSHKSSENISELPIFERKIAKEIISFEVFFDYLNRAYEKNPNRVNIILKKKIESREDVIEAFYDLLDLNTKMPYDEVFFNNFKVQIESVRDVHSQTSIFLKKNDFTCDEFYSKIFNESILMYAPNPIFFHDKSKQTVWFQLFNDKEHTFVMFFNFDEDTGDLWKYWICTFNYLFDIKNEKLWFANRLTGENKNNFYAQFISNDKLIRTRISFLGRERVQIEVNDDYNKIIYNVNLLKGRCKLVGKNF